MRALLLRAAFVLLAAWGWVTVGQPGDGRVSVEIRDKATEQIVPAMVCITSMADGGWRTPPDGHSQPPFSTLKDFYEPPPWTPGEIGPVRLTKGEYGKGQRLAQYGARGDYPFWNEPAAYFVSRPFSIVLPAGRWRLAVARGVEYLPAVQEFEITPNGDLRRTVQLARWVDMPKTGWYSGDDHVHFPRLKPEQSEFLMTWARAEDVHVANILRMGDIKATYFEQAAYGKASRYQKDDYILVTGQEDPRNDIPEQGHTMALNIQAPVRDVSKYHLYDYMFDGVHAQGGVTGYAHIAWAWDYHRGLRPDLNLMPTWDPNINTVRGKSDFFEILQFRTLGLRDYYDFLNLGIRIAASAGSDLPWGNTIGEARVYAHTGPKFSADAWFAALKQGRTFVTNGPMLQLSAGNAGPGDDLAVKKNARVQVRARAWAPPEIGTPKRLEIVAHGRVVASADASEPAKSELAVEFPLIAERSQWVAARVTTANGGVAHTSPVYILVDGERNFADPATAASISEQRTGALDFIQARLGDAKFTGTFAPGEKEALLERIAEARQRYAAIAAKGATK